MRGPLAWRHYLAGSPRAGTPSGPDTRQGEEGMIIASISPGKTGSFANFWQAHSSSSGILFYLYLADVSVPLLGTSFVETPQISGGRSIVHFILFLLCFYFGFVRKPKGLKRTPSM
jgi:hypothetical protein